MITELLILFTIGLALCLAAYILRYNRPWRNALAIIGGLLLFFPLLLMIYFFIIIFTA